MGCRGAGFGVSDSSLSWKLFLSEVQVCLWAGGWRMASPCPLVPRDGNVLPPLFRRPSQKSEQSPLLCPRLSSDPYPQPVCSWAIGMPSAIVLLCFISGQWLGFITLYLKGPGNAWTHSPTLKERLAVLCQHCSVPEKQSLA